MQGMNPDKIDSLTIQQFNKWSKSYDSGIWNIYFQAAIERALKLTSIKNKRILDLSCGTGNLLVKACIKYQANEAVGLDLSPEMLKKAATKVSAAELSNKISFVESEAGHIPYPQSHFDVVFCLNAFHHYTNQSQTIKEVNRVLKSGGFFILLDPFSNNMIRGLWIRLIKKAFREPFARFLTREEIKNLVAELNFTQVLQMNFLYFTLFTVAKKYSNQWLSS